MPAISKSTLHQIITSEFAREEDADFEEGFCIDWAVALVRWLRRHAHLSARPYVVYDQYGLAHCTVWVDSMRTAFDWRGADAQTRWQGEWKLLRNFNGLCPGSGFLDLCLQEHHDALTRITTAARRFR